MSEIAPNSTIYVLKGVPLDKSYNHTVKYNNKSIQTTGFMAYTKYSYTNLMYQRAEKNTLKIAQLCDDLYDCNYMMFQNTAYGTKWFYAFIDNVEYVNNNTTLVYYTIDPMQTWCYDYTVAECFIEREHSLTDEIGDNLVDEPFNIKERIPINVFNYNFGAIEDLSVLSSVPNYCNRADYVIVISYIPNNYINVTDPQFAHELIEDHVFWDRGGVNDDAFYTSTNRKGVFVYNQYFGMRDTHVFIDTSSPDNLNKCLFVLEKTIENIEAAVSTNSSSLGAEIVDIVQYPASIWSTSIRQVSILTEPNYFIKCNSPAISVPEANKYYPKNNKLFTSPYMMLEVYNNLGSKTEYLWEYFSKGVNTRPQASLTEYIIGRWKTELAIIPNGYLRENNFNEGCYINVAPTILYSKDAYNKWWAENQSTFTNSLLTGGLSSIASLSASMVAFPAYAGVAAVGLASGITSHIAQVIQMKNNPDQLYGSSQVPAIKMWQNQFGFLIKATGIEYQQAKVIDDYFTMFGYAVNQVKQPNIFMSNVTVRPHWNFVKTNGCIIHPATNSGLPAEHENLISQIFDKGITFWKRLDEIGNYSLNNAPV